MFQMNRGRQKNNNQRYFSAFWNSFLIISRESTDENYVPDVFFMEKDKYGNEIKKVTNNLFVFANAKHGFMFGGLVNLFG